MIFYCYNNLKKIRITLRCDICRNVLIYHQCVLLDIKNIYRIIFVCWKKKKKILGLTNPLVNTLKHFYPWYTSQENRIVSVIKEYKQSLRIQYVKGLTENSLYRPQQTIVNNLRWRINLKPETEKLKTVCCDG